MVGCNYEDFFEFLMIVSESVFVLVQHLFVAHFAELSLLVAKEHLLKNWHL
jgi:hypothetical protein